MKRPNAGLPAHALAEALRPRQYRPEYSLVPAVNLEAYWMMYGYLALQIEDSEGDIRQFFPNGRQVA